MMTRVSAVASAVFAATMLVRQAEGHSMMLDPPSRQGEREEEFCPHCYNARGPAAVVERAKANTSPDVLAEYGGGDVYPLVFGEFAANGNYLEPDGIAVRHGICGDPEQNSEEGTNTYSTANSNWEVPAGSVYRSGGIIEINTIYNAWHWGHMEFFLCNTETMEDPEGLPTQACFNEYPLTRAEGGSGSPIDPNYPGRYYVDPPARFFELKDEDNPILGYNVKARYYLPDIVTSHAILQMVYYTGNSCKHIGYDDFNPPVGSWPGASSPQRADWILRDLDQCGESTSYPEEFWGCSDIALSADGVDVEEASAPASNPLGREDDGEMTINYEDAGCYANAPGNWVVEGPWMSYNVCYLSCVSQGAYYMGLTNGAACYCDFNKDLDLTSLGESTDCTTECTNDSSSDMCGGPNATTVLKITPGFVEEGTTPPPTPEPETPAPAMPTTMTTPAPAPAQEMPTMMTTPSPSEAGEGECSPLWDQCGGTEWTGPTCCEAGSECVVLADCYSECRPGQCTGDPVEMWEQCGGDGWTGSTCCVEGTECTVMAPCYSSCRPPSGTSY